MVANIAALVDRARARPVPVVWVQHDDDDLAQGSAPWQLVPELVIAHTNLYWQEQAAPGRAAATVTTEAVDFGS